MLLANAAGGNIMGWSFQLTKSYSTGLMIMEVLLVIAIIIQASQGKYKFPALRPGKNREMAASH